MSVEQHRGGSVTAAKDGRRRARFVHILIRFAIRPSAPHLARVIGPRLARVSVDPRRRLT